MRLAAAVISVFLTVFGAVAAQAQGRSMIVLDGSGSMWGQIDGKAKIGIARETLGDVLSAVPEASELGLIVYGHRTKGDCGDIELAVPAAKGTGAAITAFANGISPKGKTPLSAAVRQAAEALKYTEDKATVILVTDGLETCDADPCALGRELEAAGVDFTAHVVGFGLSKEEGAQVACLAENTGGRYIEASNAETLGEALKETVVAVAEPEPAPEPEPEPQKALPEFSLTAQARLAEGGPVLDDKQIRWELYAIGADGKAENKTTDAAYGTMFEAQAPTGEYELKTRIGQIIRFTRVSLDEEKETALDVVLDGGIVVLRGMRTEGGEVDRQIRVEVSGEGKHDGAYGEGRIYMPAGALVAMGRQGQAKVEQPFELKAGETVALDMVVGTGVLQATALYAEGGPEVEANDIRYEVMEAKADLKGSRKGITGTYGSKPMDIPAGEVMVSARLDQAVVLVGPFTVKAGERTDVQIVLNAGVAAISAPGMHRIDVLGKQDIEGKRKTLTGKYGEELVLTLPAGNYAAQVRDEARTVEKLVEFTVTAGERVDVAVE